MGDIQRELEIDIRGECDVILLFIYIKFSNSVFKRLNILSTTTMDFASIKNI